MMKIIRTCNIERIFYSFKHWLLSNKIALIESFLTGPLCDCSKLVYGYSNEWDKVREYYNCLKFVIQAYFYVVVFFRYFLWNMFYLKNYINI